MEFPYHLKPKMARVQIMDAQDPPLIALVGRESVPRVSQTHQHASGQLLGLFSGLISVRTNLGTWVVPTSRAVWVPPHCPHAAFSHGPFNGWAVYVRPDQCAGLPDQPRAIAVSGLLREAVARAAQWALGEPDRAQLSIMHVILDEIAVSPADAFRLPMPSHPRLRRIAAALIDDPANDRSLDAWANWASTSTRTVSRRFVEETGLTFTAWRQRARLLRGLELLAAGQPVGAVALDLGYDNASAFIALFRRTFDTTPGRYFATDSTEIVDVANADDDGIEAVD
ncbi:AraC family transcriptional regulator [Pandoraea commovens]|uniref:Helix-turn-helix transcriptional regulator n=1 Tax=Pandoraea commovens TaxID=2508289 RepID=A0ABY5QD48_9BURK|nr:helix-turn-helix transcriptional regulator [Pandoraea commovens]UVA78722.1 helix-turn-helix transcriptional regulator [Pandoraea commovens]